MPPAAAEESRCLLCGAGLRVTLTSVFDNRLGTPGMYEIRQCDRCGLEQTYPMPSSAELQKLYEEHYNFGGEKGTAYTKFREWFLASRMYRLWLLLDGDNAFYGRTGTCRLLDVGCNEGRGLQMYHRSGFAAEGLDLNRTATQAARDRGYTVHEVPLETFQPQAPYGVVVLSNVLEHALDPRGMLLDAARILEPRGQVWISCPNNQSWLRRLFGRSWINWHVPFHVSHFSPWNLEQLLARAGFAEIQMRQSTPAAWVAGSILALLFARPGKPTRQLRNPILFAVMMLLVRMVLFPVLILGNRRGNGDCLLVTARKIK